MARSVAEPKFESIEHSSFIAMFCGEDKFVFIFSAKTIHVEQWITVFAGRGTGNNTEFRRWTWRHAVFRCGSSPPVACDYRHGKLFSHLLRVRLPRQSGALQGG